GFGDRLLEAEESLNQLSLWQFIKIWHQDGCSELLSNSHVPSSFPSIEILKLYVKPVTSTQLPTGSNLWQQCEPILHNITSFLFQYLGWKLAGDLLKRFNSNLWGG
ncbi:hypothetical protein L208DRAFT_1160348, partial [Tricholoma matsutake]